MRSIIISLITVVLLAACSAPVIPEHDHNHERERAVHDNYESHCREYVLQMGGDADDPVLFDDCMSRFMDHDPDCPFCVIRHE